MCEIMQSVLKDMRSIVQCGYVFADMCVVIEQIFIDAWKTQEDVKDGNICCCFLIHKCLKILLA